MVTVAQNAANTRYTHMDRTHSLTHLHQPSYNHVVRSASSAKKNSVHARSFHVSVIHQTLDMNYRIFIVRT